MQPMTRRQLLKSAVGSTTVFPFLSTGVATLFAGDRPQAPDPLAERRAQMGAIPIVSTPLSDSLTMLAGPGGNVIVLNGADGKLLVDTFVQPAWPALKLTLDRMSAAPTKLAINTHWHFDHADNNDNPQKTRTAILAHVNTKKRMSQAHDLLGMHFAPSPASALPTLTFMDSHRLRMNGETIDIVHIPPAHTDTDAYVFFGRAKVLHMGDVFFNGGYPFIDASTGGSINGQIAGANLGIKLSDTTTKIVPGHGALGDRASLTAYRDMLVAVRDRVLKLKAGGKRLDEVVAAKPTADFDDPWGKGFMSPSDFVSIVYNTVK